MRLRRPGLEAGAPGDHQILFLDFDGAFVDPSTFGTDSGDLSPLADFLAGWGLGPEDEDALIDAIVATFTENLRDDPHERGGNDRFDVEIRTSRDHAGPVGPAERQPDRDRRDTRAARLRHRRSRPGGRPGQLRQGGDRRRPARPGQRAGRLGPGDDQRLRHARHRHDRPRRSGARVRRLPRDGSHPRRLAHGAEQRGGQHHGHLRPDPARARAGLHLRHGRRRRRRLRHGRGDRGAHRRSGHADQGGVRLSTPPRSR